MNTDAYTKGMEHFNNSPYRCNNPFSKNSVSWLDFNRGYYQSMRRISAPPENYFDDSHQYYEVVNGERNRIKTLAEQKAIENYRKQSRGE